MDSYFPAFGIYIFINAVPRFVLSGKIANFAVCRKHI